jgi:hypothetical protein
MRKYLYLLLFIFIFAVDSMGQNKQIPIGWNNSIGLTAGYTKASKFETKYFDNYAPTNLFELDLSVMGFYIGMEFASKSTGYDVYGYSEKIDVTGYKFGPSFRIGTYDKWRCVISPYLGYIYYSVRDESNNSIGARDEYGTKEEYYLIGCKLSAVYKFWMFGINFSSREFGIHVGIDIPTSGIFSF